MTSSLNVIDGGMGGKLPDYPFELNLRLETHSFLAFKFTRWLNSRLRLLGRPEIRAYSIDLFCICQDQTPVGTLPLDHDEIAKLLHIQREEFEDLLRFEIGVLYNWHTCQCGDEVRYTHPVVLEIIEEALDKQSEAAERAASGQRRMRINRLSKTIAACGKPGLAGNPAFVERVYEWLEKYGPSKWTAMAVETAIEQISK